jgi:surface antigen
VRSRSLLYLAVFAALICRAAPPAAAGNCALWARAETGIALFGAAGGWWDEAAGRYQRGQTPAVGAILVFEPSRYMRSGHVAVVSNVIGPREILVDQSNWYRGATTRGDSVIDTSPNNDWTSVAVVDRPSGKHGRDNPTYGFIYTDAAPSGLDTYAAAHQPAAGLVRLAVASEEPIEPEPRGHHGHRHHLAHNARHGSHTTAHAGHHHAPHRLAHHASPHHGHSRA